MLAARQHLVEPGGEPVGMAAEPAVATGELRGLAAEPLGQRVRGLVDPRLRRRLIAHAAAERAHPRGG